LKTVSKAQLCYSDILNESKIYINFNDELGPYFHCKRGVHQGDPLSPFLFDLVADVLIILLHNAQEKRYIKSLDSKHEFLGLVNFHFADDTLLFLEAYSRYIEVLKWILITFEDILGLKIIFDKREIVPLNISVMEEIHLVENLGCKLTHLSITYL
jgi:Reverse transcriptase (RNA-dependent DNA polymerase)